MPSRTKKARLLGLAFGAAALPGLVLATAGSAAAAPGSSSGAQPKPVPASLQKVDTAGVLAPALKNAKGTVTVSVALSRKPVGATVAEGSLKTGGLPGKAAQQSQSSAVRSQQDQVIRQAKGLGAKTLGRAGKAANVVAMSIPAGKLAALTKIAGVVSVKPVARYQTQEDPSDSGSLAQAADYVQATQVRAQGFDGTGVKVGILDSGIDYTHKNLGGPGTTAAYETCEAGNTAAPTGICATLFGPNAPKVKGGTDFVGENWPNTELEPDPNPIDFEGHGTHVSDILGGRSADGSHKGIAPGVDLYALKVCSSVSTACSGVGILEAIDWAMDPNGDGDISDALDIINLSLGSGYGQEQDDSTVAVDTAVRAGIVAVVAAGNDANRPFIVSSPSTAARAISVAQTALPDDQLQTIATDKGITVRNSKLQPWSPAPTATITAPLAVPSSPIGCEPTDFAAFPAGAVALIARGTCNASAKAQNAQAAGAVAVIIYNNTPGDPPDFSFGGGDPVTIPTYTISQANGRALAAAVAAGAVTVTIDPADTTPLTNTTVGTSARGVAISGLRAKPDIGAPGAWLSAEVGTGSEVTSFGGTSGATPVVGGAAALLLDKFPLTTPAIVKSRLLNGASTANRTPDAEANLYPTPVSRIGAGEVRIAPAAAAAGVLLNKDAAAGNIGLGLPHLTETRTFTAPLSIRNTGTTAKRYDLSTTFRDPAEANGPVTASVPASVTVAAKGVTAFSVTITIDPRKLAEWPFTHSAGFTGAGSELDAPEFDGLVQAVSGAEKLHLGWTVLPERSADVSTAGTVKAGAKVTLKNASTVLDGAAQVYSLTGTSPKLPKPAPGTPGSAGSNVAVIDLQAAGVRDDVATGIIQFAVAGWQRQTVPLYPAGYEIDIDTNRDGTADFAVFQQEANGFGLSGQSVVQVYNIATKATSAFFFTDANYDSSTQVLSVPLSALGLTRGSTFDFDVLAVDNYFSGLLTDEIVGQTWTVGSRKYSLQGGANAVSVPAGGTTSLTVSRNASAGETTSTGLLFLYDNAKTRDAQAVRVI
ncbi:MAG TPA: S8 family serine peptidase [Mycobacteriales bacterium]